MECIINVHYDQFWFSLNWNVQAIWASDINKGRLSCRNSDNHWRVITWWKNLRGVVSTKCQLYWEIIIPKWEVVKRQDLMKSFLKVCLASWRFSTSGPLYQWDQLLLSGERCFWRLLDQEQAGCGKTTSWQLLRIKIDFQNRLPVILSWHVWDGVWGLYSDQDPQVILGHREVWDSGNQNLDASSRHPDISEKRWSGSSAQDLCPRLG